MPKATKTRCPWCKHHLLIHRGVTACVVCDLMGLWPAQARGRWKPAQ